MMYNSLWYNSLIKPPLSPADSIFAPVWAVLYLMILIALIIYIIKPYENKAVGYIYFAAQLFLNIIWSPIFFSAQNIGAALVIIILLDFFVFLLIRRFYVVSKLAGLMLIPYFLWIIFATYLNAGFFILN